MTLSDYLRFASFAWFALASVGGNLYLFNLIRRKRNGRVQSVQVLPTVQVQQQQSKRVPVRPAPRSES